MSSAKSPGTPKTSRTPKTPGTPKTAKQRKPDKNTYHPLTNLPELGVPIRYADRPKLFRVLPDDRAHVRKSMKKHALSMHNRNIPPAQYDATLEKMKQGNIDAKERLKEFRHKLEAENLESAIKQTIEEVDKRRRDQKFHDFQAKKEDKFREQSELLELWHSENPPYAGESAVSYMADSSDEGDDSSPTSSSFFGSSKSSKYKPLHQASMRPKKLAARALVFEPANSDRRWKNFRAKQIESDKNIILRLENDLKRYYYQLTENKSKHAHSSSQSGGRWGRGRITIRRRRGSSTRRRH